MVCISCSPCMFVSALDRMDDENSTLSDRGGGMPAGLR